MMIKSSVTLKLVAARNIHPTAPILVYNKTFFSIVNVKADSHDNYYTAEYWKWPHSCKLQKLYIIAAKKAHCEIIFSSQLPITAGWTAACVRVFFFQRIAKAQ